MLGIRVSETESRALSIFRSATYISSIAKRFNLSSASPLQTPIGIETSRRSTSEVISENALRIGVVIPGDVQLRPYWDELMPLLELGVDKRNGGPSVCPSAFRFTGGDCSRTIKVTAKTARGFWVPCCVCHPAIQRRMKRLPSLIPPPLILRCRLCQEVDTLRRFLCVFYRSFV